MAYAAAMATKTHHPITGSHVHDFVDELFGEDLHSRRVLSLGNAVTGAVHAAALSVSAIGAALAAANDLTTKHAVKQVDRLMSNGGLVVADLLPTWAKFTLGERKTACIALDWTDFEKDDHVVLAAYLITDHGRATPLAWKTYVKSSLSGRQTTYEDEFIDLVSRCIPEDVDVTLIADRGFFSVERCDHLDYLGFHYIIRFRGAIKVTDGEGLTQTGSEWVPANGRARRLDNARMTGGRKPVSSVICVKKKGMSEPWCLATNLVDMPTADIVKLYGRRFTIEETFRDVKDQRFGMGMKATSTARADRRDRLLFVAAMAHALLTLLGAAGEDIGFDRMLKVNTSKKRTHSLYRQGLFWYQAMPNMREERLVPLITAYTRLLSSQPFFTNVFGAL